MKTKILIYAIIAILLISVLSIVIINSHVKNCSQAYIIDKEAATKIQDFDAILVLGCQVYDDGTPSSILKDRIIRGVELYQLNTAPKIIMSGDHSGEDYDEVTVMKKVAIDNHVASQDIFLDHSGFSTYESMYRAKAVFGIQKLLIVTQEYHLYRSVYIARQLGIEAYGVSADPNEYQGQINRDTREVFARCKDFFYSMIQPAPTHISDSIDITGNGDLTNDIF